MKYVANSFSLGMIPEGSGLFPEICELVFVPSLTGVTSLVGHKETAAILGVDFAGRVTYKAEAGDVVYVAQYDGPRLPEGATSLPDGARFRWFAVQFWDCMAKLARAHGFERSWG
jgi:hypothetical protein